MARVCHTNNCPVGVASQREELRARFPGTPGDLVNYFHFVAEEVPPIFVPPKHHSSTNDSQVASWAAGAEFWQ